MSFTSTLKNEIINIEGTELEDISELSAILNLIGSKDEKIKLVTESVSVAKRVFNLIKKKYKKNCKITVRKGYSFNKKYTYILEVDDKDDLIENELGINFENKQLVPASFVVADEETKKAYLRGVFLSVGSLSDPKKSSYHLEFVLLNKDYAEFIMELLNSFNLNSKLIAREKKYMVYIKEAERISDFLKVVGAGGGLFYFEDIRIYRDHKNMTNRLNNCEQANVDKTIEASDKQIEDIEIIKEIGVFDALDDKLKIVANYRLKYPDASLTELGDIISYETSTKISKSGVYHRMKKLQELAQKIRR